MHKNKVRYIWGIICGVSSVDQITQSLSIFNVVDEVTVDLKLKNQNNKQQNSIEKINVPINLQVISLWKRARLSDQDKKIDVKLEAELLDPIGISLSKTIMEFPIPVDKKRSRHILKMNGLVVTQSGEYKVQFREIINNKEKSEPLSALIFEVTINKE